MNHVYITANPHEMGRGLILSETGTYFDPRVVEAFLVVEEEFVE
jgi:response regulator RpfG family c-di-GMP phosphodiesterase